MATTRLAIIERIADTLGRRLSGTLSSSVSAASTTVQDALARHEQDDYCNEGFFLATSSGGVVEEHRISDFSNATLSLYGSGLSTSLSSGLAYDVLLPPITPAQYRTAIKTAASKLAAKGMTRRALDTTLVATASRRYTMPAAIDISLAEAYIQATEYLVNGHWLDGSSAWTLTANASLTNDGTGGARTIKLVAAAANEDSYQEITASPGVEFEFFANVKGGGGVVAARWRYRIYDSGGSLIVGPTVIGTAVTTAAFAEEKGTFTMPANGVTLRLSFDASAAGTVYSEAPSLMRAGGWQRIPGAEREYDGETAYLVLPWEPTVGRRLKLIGRRTLESLSGDTDTISMDEPEIVAFTELACAEAWRQFGSQLGLDRDTVRTEIAVHEQEYKKALGGVSGPWRQRRHATTPTWSSDH